MHLPPSDCTPIHSRDSCVLITGHHQPCIKIHIIVTLPHRSHASRSLYMCLYYPWCDCKIRLSSSDLFGINPSCSAYQARSNRHIDSLTIGRPIFMHDFLSKFHLSIGSLCDAVGLWKIHQTNVFRVCAARVCNFLSNSVVRLHIGYMSVSLHGFSLRVSKHSVH